MEEFDRALAREAQRLNRDEVTKPVVVTTVEDIRRVVAEYDPGRNKTQAAIPISTTMRINENGADVLYKVDASTKSRSKRDILIDGLTILKNRQAVVDEIKEDSAIEVNGKLMQPAQIGNGVKALTWVDPLIKQWFGGYRDGTLICWNIGGYVYRYDAFEHKLSRTANE